MYEQGQSFDAWKTLIQDVIQLHYPIRQPGGVLVVNIADILCFPDPDMPKLQAQNIRRQRSDITREDVLAAQAAYPHYNRNQLAELLGCSEQTIEELMQEYVALARQACYEEQQKSPYARLPRSNQLSLLESR